MFSGKNFLLGWLYFKLVWLQGVKYVYFHYAFFPEKHISWGSFQVSYAESKFFLLPGNQCAHSYQCSDHTEVTRNLYSLMKSIHGSPPKLNHIHVISSVFLSHKTLLHSPTLVCRNHWVGHFWINQFLRKSVWQIWFSNSTNWINDSARCTGS